MTDRKAQHQARAQLVREGTRTLARATITDYRQASYETARAEAREHVRREYEEARDAAAEKELFGTPPEHRGTPTSIADIDALLTSIWTGEPEPVPAKPRTAADLLARLNARHKN
jgi:t-SNARE complex subunit (syntaxin)